MIRKSRPTIEELEDGRNFELADIIEHSSLHSWLRKYLFTLGWVTAPYWTLNLFALGVVALVWRRAGLAAIESFP